MKTNIVIYISSLVILMAAILLVVEYPGSGRMHVIASGLTLQGLILNVVSYVTKRYKKVA